MPQKTFGEKNIPTQANSNVVSLEEFRNYQGEVEYSSMNIFYALDIDGDKITVRLNDER